MKVAVISESPYMATGFGVASDQFCRQLVSYGWDVACFGVGFTGYVKKPKETYRVWLSGRDANDFYKDVSIFLEEERPNIVLLIGDAAYYVNLWARFLSIETCIPQRIMAHIVADGFPVKEHFVEPLRHLSGVMAATNALSKHLRDEHDLSAPVVPQAVDTTIFKPLPEGEKARKRSELGIEDQFLIGVFGRNAERKQQPRVLEAVRILRDVYGLDDIRVYMHCRHVDDPDLRGWDLVEVARSLGVEESVTFPRDFQQLQGVRVNSLNRAVGEGAGMGFDELSYVGRLSICDMVLNPAFAGGFEFVTLEAQACGVPVAVTNDYGNMSEVAGKGASLMEGSFGVWCTGARQFLVEPTTIARHVIRVRQDRRYREQLIKAGFDNVKHFSWEEAGKLMHTNLVEVLSRSH